MRCNALVGALFVTTVMALPVMANQDVINQSSNPRQWVLQSGDYTNQRYSKLDQINRNNVATLQVTNVAKIDLHGHEGSPLVVGTTMYVHSPISNIVYALDLDNDGQVVWTYTLKQNSPPKAANCCDTINLGLVYAEGKIFLHQVDATVVALDAKTGREIWKTVSTDLKYGQTITGTVLPVKDKIIVGASSGESGHQCHVTAYDINTGKQVWRAYSAGPDEKILFDPEKTTSLGKPVGKDSSVKTWKGEQWQIGGGCAWGAYSYDPETNLIFYGSGNSATWDPKQSPRDNKWSMAIFARDVDTGMASWVYQMTPSSRWDYDGINEMILVDIDVKGSRRNALVHFDRNGLAYTIDRVTGELLVAEKYDPAVNWTSGVEFDKSKPNYGRPYVVDMDSTIKTGADVNTKGICPAALGTRDLQPAAFSPKSGLFYVPTIHICMDRVPNRASNKAGQPGGGNLLAMYPAPYSHGGTGNFIAWDASAGKIIWLKPEPFSVWSGALVTAGDVVFYGTQEGYFKALDISDGKELFRFKTPSSIIGNVMTYMLKGKQYVAVLSGIGGWARIRREAGLMSPNEDPDDVVNEDTASSNRTEDAGALIVFSLP